ncbi:MAG: hypothetical protein AAF500_05265 [Myxococcota bacterium]
MEQEERDALIEEVASAWRPESANPIQMHPAWQRLDEAGRIEAFELAQDLRQIEAALDPEGQSATAKAVLARVAALETRNVAEPAASKAKVISFPRRLFESQPLAVAAVAMLAVGFGVWASRDGVVHSPGEPDLPPAVVADRPSDELPLDDDPAPTPKTAQPQPGPAQDVQERLAAREPETKKPRRERSKSPAAKRSERRPPPSTTEDKKLAEMVDPSPRQPTKGDTAPEELPKPALRRNAVRAPNDTANAMTGSQTTGTATEEEKRICRTRVTVVEKMRRQMADYMPSPEEQLALGRCYITLGDKAKARAWLERAATDPKTKPSADKALKELDP